MIILKQAAPSVSYMFWVHSFSPSVMGRRRNRTKPDQVPTSKQLEMAPNSVVISTERNRMLQIRYSGCWFGNRMSKIPDFTPCFVTPRSAPSASSSMPNFNQLLPSLQTRTKEHISVAAMVKESLITQRSVFGSLQECSAQQVTPKSYRQAKPFEASQKHSQRTHGHQDSIWSFFNPASTKGISQELSIPGSYASSELCFNLNIIIPEDIVLCKSSVRGSSSCAFLYGCLNICFESYPIPTANRKISATSPYHTAFPVWNSLWSGP